MKKTIIALMALVGVASAAGTETQLLDKTWGSGYNMSIEEVDGSNQLVYTGGGWGVNAIELDLGAGAVNLSQNQVLTLSVTYNTTNYDSSFTLALVGSDYAFVGGRSFKDTGFRVGVTEELGLSRGYAFAGTNDADNVANITSVYTEGQDETVTAFYKELAGTDITPNATVDGKLVINPNSFTLSVSYDQAINKFVGKMTAAGKSESIILDDTFKVNDVVATFVSQGESRVTDLTMNIVTVPEPTTATLSLLALAGLAVRRRRK